MGLLGGWSRAHTRTGTAQVRTRVVPIATRSRTARWVHPHHAGYGVGGLPTQQGAACVRGARPPHTQACAPM